MRNESVLSVLFVLAGIITGMLLSHRYVIALAVYLVALALLVVRAGGRLPVRIRPAIGYPVAALWGTFVVGLLLHPTSGGFVRLVAFVGVTGTALFVFPAAIDRATVQRVLAYTAAALVVIALPSIVVGRYYLGPIRVGVLALDHPAWGLPPINPRSIFRHPNLLAAVAGFGAIAAVGEYVRARGTRRLIAVLAFLLDTFGLFITRARAPLLALLAAVVLYGAYRYGGRRGLAVCTVLGALAGTTGLLLLVGVLPGPAINLNSRDVIWRAAYRGFFDHPVLGWGIGRSAVPIDQYATDIPQVNPSASNSYIRMFLMSGVIGGIAYLALFAGAVASAIETTTSETDLVAYLLVVAFVIIQMFNGLTLFGLSTFSMLGALFVGQTQPASMTRTIPLLPRRWTERQTTEP